MKNRLSIYAAASLACLFALFAQGANDPADPVEHTGRHTFQHEVNLRGRVLISDSNVTATAGQLNNAGSGIVGTITPSGGETLLNGRLVVTNGVVLTNRLAGTCRNGSRITYNDVRTEVITWSAATAPKVELADGAHGGSTNIFTFPEGRILILGAALAGAASNTPNFNASTADTYSIGIGSAAAGDDDALTSTEVDIIASTTIDTTDGTVLSTAWEADMTAGADSVYDGTAAAQSLFLNAACAAANNSDTNVMYATGTLRIVWVFLGDD